MISKLVIVHKSSVSLFPPLLTFIEVLKNNGIEVLLICGREDEKFKEHLNKLCAKTYFFDIPIAPIGGSKLIKIRSWLEVRFLFWKLIEKENLLSETFYFATADTVLAMGSRVQKLKYILNLYELFDFKPYYLKNLKPYALTASKIVCPEITRANIFKVWWKLDKLPFVVPNRPLARPSFDENNIPEIALTALELIKDKKFIVYQGLITKDRNLTPLCEAIKSVEGYHLVVMGKSTSYLEQLKKEYPHIIHVPFILPPYHLMVTSKSRMGILSYDYSSLNNIFCAPNKIWEYASIGLPMLGNNIPGLYNVIRPYNLGTCVEFDDSKAIARAIAYIDDNHDAISANSYSYFDSVKTEDCILDIVKDL